VKFSGTPRPIINSVEEYQAILDGGDPSMLTADLSRKVVLKNYEKLCRMSRVSLIGDIAFYYLSYVEMIAEMNPNVRFVCLKRDKEETVQSWIRKAGIDRWLSKRMGDRIASAIVRTPYHTSRNFWMEHDGTVWQLDPVWDKCFPKFKSDTIEDAISQYWDYYYEESEKLVKKLPNVFRIFATETLEQPESQADIPSYCGAPLEQKIQADVHLHKSCVG
jgi:hypothetical protein